MVSPPVAGKLAFDLFCTPYPKYKKKKAPAIFNQAKPLHITLKGDGISEKGNIRIHGFEWKPLKPNGQTVLIVHGYASYFYKFDQYIQPLLKEGFRVIGFDAPGHGLSEGKHINIVIYKHAIENIIKELGPIDHFIGHSLGAITLAMIAENIENPIKHKFVLIAPATKTTTTFERYFNMMHLSPAIRAAFNELVEKRSGMPITYFEADRAIENFTGDLLWVHDRDDLVCPYKDLEEFQKKAPQNIKFLITNELGHNKLYKTPEIIDKIVAFLGPIE
ncbi:MAG: alpha/beta fold hydrolase [Chitinophagaceae bacterium]|nr:alpha/beta fold hydrolase [Chitinophagaceae bacterium]